VSELTVAEVEQLRREVDDYLPDLVVLQTRTDATDDWGGEADVFADRATVRAKVGTQSVSETLQIGLSAVEAQTVILVPGGTDVRQSDRIRHGARTYEVVSVSSMGGTWEITIPVLVKEVS
jgi:SPP1 family predicted phage head-tail adaptor